jgi:hypothetical protein
MQRLREQLGEDLVELVLQSAGTENADTVSFLEELAAVKAAEEASRLLTRGQKSYKALVERWKPALASDSVENCTEILNDGNGLPCDACELPCSSGTRRVARRCSAKLVADFRQDEVNAPELLTTQGGLDSASDGSNNEHEHLQKMQLDKSKSIQSGRDTEPSRQASTDTLACERFHRAKIHNDMMTRALPRRKSESVKSSKLQMIHSYLRQAAASRSVAAAIGGPTTSQKKHLCDSHQYLQQAMALEDEVIQEFLNEPTFSDMDLHGLTTRAAARIMREKIRAACSWIRQHGSYPAEFRVVVGRGRHSKDRYSRLCKTVTNILAEHGVCYRFDEHGGAILVFFRKLPVVLLNRSDDAAHSKIDR